MQIYVIRPGDSLWNISQAFNSSVNAIQQANELPDPNRLVVGQTIVIPITGQYYWTRPGDSLWSIGRRFGINYIELARINNIALNSILQVGIRIYIPPKAKTRAEINAYIEPTGSAVSPQLLQTARETASLLTYLAPFSYRANRDGSLTPMPLDGLPQIASQNNTTLMMVITNIEGEGFSGELAGAILSNPDIQDTLIDNIIATARQTGNIFSDAHFDF